MKHIIRAIKPKAPVDGLFSVEVEAIGIEGAADLEFTLYPDVEQQAALMDAFMAMEPVDLGSCLVYASEIHIKPVARNEFEVTRFVDATQSFQQLGAAMGGLGITVEDARQSVAAFAQALERHQPGLGAPVPHVEHTHWSTWLSSGTNPGTFNPVGAWWEPENASEIFVGNNVSPPSRIDAVEAQPTEPVKKPTRLMRFDDVEEDT